MPPELPPMKESDSSDFDSDNIENVDNRSENPGDQSTANQTDNHDRLSKTRRAKQGRTTSKFSAADLGKRAKTIGSLGMIPILLGVGPIVGALMGRWLDQQFDTDPWLTILFVIFGFIAAVREMMRLLKRNELDEARDKREREEKENERFKDSN